MESSAWEIRTTGWHCPLSFAYKTARAFALCGRERAFFVGSKQKEEWK